MKLILRFFCYLDYRVFLRLMAVLPRWLALPFVWLRGGLNFLFDADWRTLSLGQQYVRTATQKTMQAWHQKQTHPTTYWQQPTWLTLRRYLHTSIEEYDATHLKQVCDTSPFHIDGLEWLKQAQAQKIGVVLVHAHFDSLYPGLIFLAQQGLRVNLVSTRLMFDERVCAGASQHFAHKMAQLNQALAPGGVFHVEENLLFFTRALKNGEIVVIAGDGPASSPSRATEVSFWGDQRLMAPGPEFLLRSAKCRIGAYLCWREGNGFHIQISPPRSLQEQGIAHAYAALETKLFEMPWRWWAADLYPTLQAPEAITPPPIATENIASTPLVLSASTPNQWPVLFLSDADAADVCELFERIFKHPMSATFHAWKYADGRGLAAGIRDHEGYLVAHYGATLRVMQWGTATFTGVQVGDVMVAPEIRDVFAKFGPFGRVAQGFIRRYLGPENPYPIGFGFPNTRAGRLGQRLKLYWPVAQVWAWRWQPQVLASALTATATAQYRLLDLGLASDVGCIYELVTQMTADFSAKSIWWPVRNADWWRHRYVHHPHFSYRIYAVYPATAGSDTTVRPVGALVLKTTPDTGHCELMDWIGPLSFTSDVLAYAAHICASERQGSELELWSTEGIAAYFPTAWLELADARTVACEAMVTHEHLLGQPVSGLKHSVWLTGGDTDFR